MAAVFGATQAMEVLQRAEAEAMETCSPVQPADSLPPASEISQRYLADTSGRATAGPAGVNPTVAGLQASSGWRQAVPREASCDAEASCATGGENATAELTALRDYGCDKWIDVRGKLSWAEFKDEYVRQVNGSSNLLAVHDCVTLNRTGLKYYMLFFAGAAGNYNRPRDARTDA